MRDIEPRFFDTEHKILAHLEWEAISIINFNGSYMDIAEKYGVDASQLANQFVTTRDFVTSNIIGATSMEQLKLAVTSVELELTEEMMKDIEAVHLAAPNICP